MKILTAFFDWLNNSTDKPSREPLFKYKDVVVVTGGFFKGEYGTIRDIHVFFGKNRYLVSRKGWSGFIDEKDLDLKK